MSGIADKRSPEIRHAASLPPEKIRSLSRQLAPPSSGKSTVVRPVHPDTVLIIFSCILPVFLVGILKQQPVMFIPALLVLAVLYALYFFLRKSIVARFERDQQYQKDQHIRIEKAIKDWMKLYYCDRDGGIFMPGKDELVPPDQMIRYLMK